MIAKPHNAFTLENVEMTLVERPLFYLGGHYVTFLGLIAFAVFVATGFIAARTLQSRAIRRFLSRFKIDNNLIAILTTILSFAALIFFIVSAINVAGIPLHWNAPLPGVTLSILQIFLLIALLIGVFWLSSRTKRFLFNRFLSKSGIDRALQHAIAQIVGYIVLIVGIFIVLDNAGIHLGALTVFAGAVGVGVGFGLQNIASARSTVIMTSDNIAMIVPNSKFIDSPVTNWHYGDPRVRFRLPVGVAYGSDVNKVREALIAAAREHSATLSDPEPTAYLEKFGDSTIDFELVAWTEEMSYKPRRFKSDLNYLIYKHLTAAGIEIPNPQRDLHIRDGVIKVKNDTAQVTEERTED